VQARTPAMVPWQLDRQVFGNWSTVRSGTAVTRRRHAHLASHASTIGTSSGDVMMS
jgi:hypothetical protein